MCLGANDDVDLAYVAFENGDVDGAERILDQMDSDYGGLRRQAALIPGLQPVWARRRNLRTLITQARSEQLAAASTT